LGHNPRAFDSRAGAAVICQHLVRADFRWFGNRSRITALQILAQARAAAPQHGQCPPLITLYSYPSLFGVADNNGYGLKVFAFLRLVAVMHQRFGKPASTLPQYARGVPFVLQHMFGASAAPRGQLPYIVDDNETIGDSEIIIAHLISRYALIIDAALGRRELDLNLLITRMLDDLYWVMSYSRWKDQRYWPAFRSALMREHPNLTAERLQKARDYNFQRYHFQGIGRYAPAAAYARGLADLKVLTDLVPTSGYVHGSAPTSIDAGIYGFIANIYFYNIDTPLKQFVAAQKNLVCYCSEIHETVMRGRAHGEAQS
jgi:glutathione S-transferase